MPSHLCTLLGCIVIEGVEPSALPSVHQQVTGIDPPVAGSYTPPRRLPASPQSRRSTSQLVRWIRTSSSRNSRATWSARARRSPTGNAENILSSERSCRE